MENNKKYFFITCIIIFFLIFLPTKTVTYEFKIPYTALEPYTDKESYEVEVPYSYLEPYQDIEYTESVDRAPQGNYWSTCSGACRCTKYDSFPGYIPSIGCTECTCTRSAYVTRYRNVTKYQTQTLYRDVTKMRTVKKIRTEIREKETNWLFGYNTTYSFHLPIISGTVNAGQITVAESSDQSTTIQSDIIQNSKAKPSIVPVGTYEKIPRTFSYAYKGTPYTITIPVDLAIYYGARDARSKWSEYIKNNYESKSMDGPLVKDAYLTMLADPAMDNFYSDLLKELNGARYKGGNKLSDDEYLEMITSFIQQIEYDPNAKLPRYPIEVIYDGKGDCDEKSMLLTALLSKEGYDVALLVFPEESHVTAGIGVDPASNPTTFRIFKDRDYKINSNSEGGLNYIYIETTYTTIIGFYLNEFENVKDPIIVHVGNGTLHYRKLNYVMKIFADAKKIYEILDSSAYSVDYSTKYSLQRTYNLVMTTNDIEDAWIWIRNSELRHITNCWSCD